MTRADCSGRFLPANAIQCDSVALGLGLLSECEQYAGVLFHALADTYDNVSYWFNI